MKGYFIGELGTSDYAKHGRHISCTNPIFEAGKAYPAEIYCEIEICRDFTLRPTFRAVVYSGQVDGYDADANVIYESAEEANKDFCFCEDKDSLICDEDGRILRFY